MLYMKKLFIFIIFILVLCAGAMWFLASGALNDIIKQQIESIGSEATGQTVQVKSVDVKLSEGSGAINGFTLSNPEKYSAPHAFALEQVLLDLAISDSTQKLIVIDEVSITAPKASVEFTQAGGSNIKDILDAISKTTPENKAPAPQKTIDSKAVKSNDGPRILIRKVALLQTQLSVDLSKLGNKLHNKQLPDIVIKNIGGEEGLPADQLGAALSKSILKSIYKSAKDMQKSELKSKLKNKAQEKLSKFFK